MFNKLKNELRLIRGMIHSFMDFCNLIPSDRTERIATDVFLFVCVFGSIVLFFYAIMQFNITTTGSPF
ncbi:MAG: hypothetical protein ACTSSO_07130 [Candidatus Hodarchaeales archaeon]